jgi:translation initiation factor 3 subunit E
MTARRFTPSCADIAATLGNMKKDVTTVLPKFLQAWSTVASVQPFTCPLAAAHIVSLLLCLRSGASREVSAQAMSKVTQEAPTPLCVIQMEGLAVLKIIKHCQLLRVPFLQNPQLVQELRPNKQYHIHMLQERFQIGPNQVEALYQYIKFQFEWGNYLWAADYLYQYCAMCTNLDRSSSALWGKLAAEIIMQNWDVALEELNCLKEIIDSKNFSSPLNQLQNRIWLTHWSLFIFFNHENGINGAIDLFFQDRNLIAIQTNAHHLLRYLATTVVVNKRRMLK